jgi:hypothetical protein
LLQAKLAAPLVSLLQAHKQPVDPNLVQLAEAWAQAEAALQAQGKSVAALESAGGGGVADEQEEEGEEAAAAAVELPEDLQVRLSAGSVVMLCIVLCHGVIVALKQQQDTGLCGVGCD